MLEPYAERLPLPESIDVEPTIRCTFSCVMCQRTYWTRRAPDMSIAEFRHLLASFPSLKRIKIQGIGEPLLNQDIFAMIAHAKAQGTYVTTYTNGSPLQDSISADRLLGSGIDLVRISMDGGTRETFQALRKGSDFEQIVRNIAQLVRRRRQNALPAIELWVVGMSPNIRELSRIVDIGALTGVDAINLQLIMNTFDYKEEIGQRLVSLQMHQSDDMTFIREGLAYAQRRGITLTLATSKARSYQRPCHWPFDSAFISVEGEVVPCCTIADPRVASMGNAFRDDFSRIWVGERYQEFRRTILKRQLLAACKNCYLENHQDLIAAVKSGIAGG